jgi:flagellar hook assembly protein FlgD
VEIAEAENRPLRFAVGRASPNPSSGETEIHFSLDRSGPVRVSLYDVTGRLVRELEMPDPLDPGEHALRWDGRNRNGRPAPAGLYFVRIESGGRVATGRLLRLP